MQMIKEAIGKDLSRISMPVYLNEPLSIVQKGTENNEYSSLLKQASKEPDSLKRLALLSVYNGSRMNHIGGRIKKPFNSLLGETYELITNDYRIIIEQVGHHPPETA